MPPAAEQPRWLPSCATPEGCSGPRPCYCRGLGWTGIWGAQCRTVSGFVLPWWSCALCPPLLGIAAAAAGLGFACSMLQRLLPFHLRCLVWGLSALRTGHLLPQDLVPFVSLLRTRPCSWVYVYVYR